MGIQLISKYKGQCPECDESYKVGDKIYFDGDNKNSRGKSIVCVDVRCFREQGGKLDTDSSKEFLFIPPSLDSDVMVQLGAINIDGVLNTIMVKANNKTKELYPNLPEDSNTFGQIRNSMADKYLKLYLVKHK